MDAPPEASPTAPRPRKPFRLTRYFSWTSLLGIVAVTAAMIAAQHRLTENQLIDHESRANADQARAFANAVWATYEKFVTEADGRTRADLLADPTYARLDGEVRAKMRGLTVAKIKIYTPTGLTVYSTDPKQVGEDKSTNAGFVAARDGRVVSQVTFRERFDAFEGQINNRNLIASYVPVRAGDDGAVQAVLEVYSDVTDLQQAQHQALAQVALMALTLLGLLYLFLHAVVRKADRLIASQEAERAAREAQMRHQAYHDALTGLPNRAYFGERLQEALSLAARHSLTCAVMFIDLDRFKIVNDSLGHQAGDELLSIAATRIHSCMRGSDLLFRMGGDEFTVILPSIVAPEDAAVVARRILQALQAPVTIHGHELSIGASVGIAVCPGDGDDAATVLKNADAAMYSAKDGGRNTYAFYRAEMNLRARQRLGREAELKHAFHDGEFLLHYQPRVRAADGAVVSAEALLRWQSPQHGMVPPGDFIGVLEESGLIQMVGEWVLRTACAQARRWHETGRAGLRVSVNVSPLQFQHVSFVPMVRRVLQETRVDAHCIELELTESMLISGGDGPLRTIRDLKALGLRLAIDDFGTGYSSMNYLRRFEVDFLKIDRSFIAGIETGVRERALVKALVDLSRALDMTVVAEGVETGEQARYLGSIGCHELQGYLFARPMPAAEATALLATGRPLGEAASPVPAVAAALA